MNLLFFRMTKWIQFAGSVLLFWLGVALATKPELTVFRVVEYYLPNWIAATIIVRLLVIVLLVLAGLTLTGRISRFGKYIIPVLLLIPIVDSVMMLAGHTRFYSLFLFSNTKVELIMQLALSFALFALFLIKGITPLKAFGNRWVAIVLVLAAIGAAFIRPVYVDDWYHPEKNQSGLSASELGALLNEQGIKPENNRFMVAFFESSCGYCAWAATKMGVNQRNGKLPELIIAFPGDMTDAEQFIEEHKLEAYTHFVLERDYFLELAGNSYPSIYLVSDDKAVHWTGSGFGYRVLEYVAP